MDGERFAAVAEAYGGDLRLWPEDERPAASARLSGDPRAERLLDEQRRLDDVLHAWRPMIPSRELRDAVLAGAGRSLRIKAAGRRRRAAVWMSGAGLATAAVAGLLVGATLAPIAPWDSETDALTAALYADPAGALANLPESSFT